MSTIHTIFGAGQIGVMLAQELAAQGYAVRLIRRSAPGPAIEGVTWMQGDALDRTFTDEACRGAAAVYNCTNPPDYGRWDGVLQPLYRSVREAAGRSDAVFVQLDCLYMYGKPSRAPFDETEPMRPCRAQGEMRRAMVQEMWDAHHRGDVRATTGRASDYFGPHTPLSVALRPDVYDAILRGGTAWMLGNPDQPHSYNYTPDVARGLAVLGTHEAAVGRAWHLPTAAQLTTRALLERFAAVAGTTIKVRRVPHWVLRSIGVFSSMVGALAQMTYQWDVPYLIDDGAFRRTFAVGPTDLDEAIVASLEAHRRTRGSGGAQLHTAASPQI